MSQPSRARLIFAWTAGTLLSVAGMEVLLHLIDRHAPMSERVVDGAIVALVPPLAHWFVDWRHSRRRRVQAK